MHVRDARPADADAVYAVHAAAFPTTAEAALVDALELDGDVLAALVTEVDGQIVAHAVFSRMTVTGDGVPIRAAALAPVATLPDFQRRGFAGALIEIGHEQLRSHGIAISFVLGDPAYYERFGYRAETAAPFASPYAGPHLMALRLDKALSLPESGSAQYAPAFSQLG